MSEARQGHKYLLDGVEVMALSSGPRPRIAAICRDKLWPLDDAVEVDATELVALPMRYFHNQVPK